MRIILVLFFLPCLSFSQPVVGKWVRDGSVTKIRWAVLDTQMFVRSVEHGWTLFGPNGVKQVCHVPVSDPSWKQPMNDHPELRMLPLLLDQPAVCSNTMLALGAASADLSFSVACRMGWGVVDSGRWTGPYFIQISGDSVTYRLQRTDTVLPCISALKLKQEGKTPVLGWEARAFPQYSTYFLERNKIRIAGPLRHLFTVPGERWMYFTDTSAKEGRCYQYRLIPEDPFGRSGPVSPSDTICVEKEETGWLRIDSVKCIKEDQVKIHYSSEGIHEKQKIQVWVGRSVTERNLISAKDLTLRLPDSIFYLGLQYRNISSLPFYIHRPDTIPPQIPTHLRALPEKKGVRLSWNEGKGEIPAFFRIFRSYSPKGEFTELISRPVHDTTYLDSIKPGAFSRTVFYCLKSVDGNYNHSRMSDTVFVLIPDTLPPPAPRFVQWELTQDALRGKAVFSMDAGDSTSIHFLDVPHRLTGPGDSCSFSFEKLAPGSYTVHLVTTDQFGNRSVSEPRNFVISAEKMITLDTLHINRKHKFISLHWNTGRADRIQILRSVNEGPWHEIATLDGKTTQWMDLELYMGNRYSYRVVAHYRDSPPVISEERTGEY